MPDDVAASVTTPDGTRTVYIPPADAERAMASVVWERAEIVAVPNGQWELTLFAADRRGIALLDATNDDDSPLSAADLCRELVRRYNCPVTWVTGGDPARVEFAAGTNGKDDGWRKDR